ncbi:hypothetical protein [Aerosakkonema sp. BLCC-F183]|uniref:hypothetical protein n=1 Tax=Aerosakkonema sp. BLCC-F183 TaxID=3342834 RepID=UPI0035BC012D
MKYLQSAGGAGSAEAVQAPAGTQLKKFQDYLGGSITVSYSRNADSQTKGLLAYTGKLFGLKGEESKALMRVSKRAIDGKGNAGIDPTEDLQITAGNTGVFNGNYVPANAIVSTRNTTGTVSTKDSQLTGRKYKTKGGASYTYPFGRKADTDIIKDRIEAIKTKVGVAVEGKSRSVSFLPEDIIW